MASTGFRRDAVYAGNKPANTPIITETDIPSVMFFNDNTIPKSTTELMASTPKKTNIKPISPPNKHSTTDSTKNCNKIK